MNKEQHELIVTIKHSSIIKLSYKQELWFQLSAWRQCSLSYDDIFLPEHNSLTPSTLLHSTPCTTQMWWKGIAAQIDARKKEDGAKERCKH